MWSRMHKGFLVFLLLIFTGLIRTTVIGAMASDDSSVSDTNNNLLKLGLIYSTYLGGITGFHPRVQEDSANDIAVDNSGNAYVVGTTWCSDFPTKNAFQSSHGGGYDAFVAKFSGNGDLIYSTYIGKSAKDEGLSIAVDSSGNAYVMGRTASSDFPVKNAYQDKYGGLFDVFVVKLSSSGSLIYATYLGGSNEDYGTCITLDKSGNAYVLGMTGSSDFPVKNAYQEENGGRLDAFVAKLSSDGMLIYSTYLGGSSKDNPAGIDIDSSDNIYLTGTTVSSDFPVRDAYHQVKSGLRVAFLTKMSDSGDIIYSTYLGDTGFSRCEGIAVDKSNNVYVIGSFQLNDNTQAVNIKNLIKLSSVGVPIYSINLCGNGSKDIISDITTDNSGNVYLTGTTYSQGFPVLNAYQDKLNGVNDALLLILSGDGSPIYSTYLGGSGGDKGNGIAADKAGNVYVAGLSVSSDFPVYNAYQDTGWDDAFVAKFYTGIAPTHPPIANSQSVEIMKGKSIQINLTGNDPDKDDITGYKIVNEPKNGKLSGELPNITYSPNPDFTGVDSFTFMVFDGTDWSEPATVEITVNTDDSSASAHSNNVELVGRWIRGSITTPLIESIYVENDYAYLGATNELVILNVGNPKIPIEIGRFGTVGQFTGLHVVDKHVYAIMEGDFLIIDVSNYSHLDLEWLCQTPGYAYEVCTIGDYAYVSDDTSGLQVVDINAHSSTRYKIVGNCDTPGKARGICVSGKYAYIADDLEGLRVIDISDPTLPTEVGFCNIPGKAIDIQLLDGIAYITGDKGLTIIDVSIPSRPVILTTYDTSYRLFQVSVSGSLACVTTYADMVIVIDISDPMNPEKVGSYIPTADTLLHPYSINPDGSYNIPGSMAIYVYNDQIYVSYGSEGLYILQYVEPSAPKPNNPPIANSQSLETMKGKSIQITLTGNDPDKDDIIGYKIVNEPKNGKRRGELPNIIYIPNPNFIGVDSFAFIVYDGIDWSEPATVEITVNADDIFIRIYSPEPDFVLSQKQISEDIIAVYITDLTEEPITGCDVSATFSNNDPGIEMIESTSLFIYDGVGTYQCFWAPKNLGECTITVSAKKNGVLIGMAKINGRVLIPADSIITGTVQDENNRPIPGAIVELNVVYTAITDISGHYKIEFKSIVKELVTLKTLKDGYSTVSKEMKVIGGQDEDNVDFNLLLWSAKDSIATIDIFFCNEVGQPIPLNKIYPIGKNQQEENSLDVTVEYISENSRHIVYQGSIGGITPEYISVPVNRIGKYNVYACTIAQKVVNGEIFWSGTADVKGLQGFDDYGQYEIITSISSIPIRDTYPRNIEVNKRYSYFIFKSISTYVDAHEVASSKHDKAKLVIDMDPVQEPIFRGFNLPNFIIKELLSEIVGSKVVGKYTTSRILQNVGGSLIANVPFAENTDDYFDSVALDLVAITSGYSGAMLLGAPALAPGLVIGVALVLEAYDANTKSLAKITENGENDDLEIAVEKQSLDQESFIFCGADWKRYYYYVENVKVKLRNQSDVIYDLYIMDTSPRNFSCNNDPKFRAIEVLDGNGNNKAITKLEKEHEITIEANIRRLKPVPLEDFEMPFENLQIHYNTLPTPNIKCDYTPTLAELGWHENTNDQYQLQFIAYSPVEMNIVDPEGRIISKNSNEVPGSTYTESDLDDDGHEEQIITISEPLIGNYQINLVQKPGVDLEDKYSLEAISNDQKVTIAKDVSVKDIPLGGYTFDTLTKQVKTITSPEKGPSLGIYTNVIAIEKGKQFNVNIEVDKITELFGASFELQFDGDIIEATGAKPGDALGSDVVFLNVPSEGKISVAISKKEGDEPFSGSGTLATIDFKAKVDGKTEIAFDKSKLTLQKADGSPIPGFSELTIATCEITIGQISQTMISMEPSVVQVKPGDEFTLKAVVSDIDKLFGASFEIQYDGNILDYVSSSAGDFIGSDVVFFSIKGDNAINMAISMKTGAEPASGSGTLAEIEFKAKSAGKSQVSYREDTLALKHPDGTPISVTVSNCSVTVGEGIVKGDVNNDGNVRSNDAILALRIASGLIEPTPEQRQAADMNGDGMVRSNDAILILREAAGLAAPGINALPAANRKVTVTLPESHGVAGERLTIPLKVDNADLLAGGDVCITYDNTVLRALGVESNLMLVSNIRESGRVYLSFAGVHGLREDTLADIQFDILRDSVSSLEFDTVELYQPDALPLASGRLNGRFSSWAIPPERSDLMQNYPNPFNPETWIPYQLRKGGEVTVRIHSITGELIRELKLGYKSAGLYVTQDRAAYWDGRNEAGELAASGVYFYHIQAGDFADTRKMTLAK